MTDASTCDVQRDACDCSYWRILSSLDKGLLVQFNTSDPSASGTPELRVVSVSDGDVYLENGDNMWHVDDATHHDGPALFQVGDHRKEFYEVVTTIEVVGCV